MRFDLATFLENVTPPWLRRLLYRRCPSVLPVEGGRSLRCQERSGHEGDHRHGTVITWVNPAPSHGHMHVVEGRRR
jgi:hypothetical protein